MKKLLLLALLPSVSYAMPTVIIDGKMVWVPPTTYVDGTEITETMTFPVYCNDGTRNFIQSDQISEETINEKPLTGFLAGNHVCAVTAKTTKGESVFSNTVNFTCSGQCLYGQGPKSVTIEIK